MSAPLWILLALTGCAFQQAMRTGDKLAAAGDWTAAYAAYTEAAEKKPDEPEAITARDHAKDMAVEAEIRKAREALELAEFEKCKEAMERASAIDPDRPEVFDLGIALEKGMATRFDLLWQTNDQRGAYAVAVTARKVLPKAVFLNDAFEKSRAHFKTEADRLLRAKEFEGALATIKTITDLEPDRQADVAGPEQEIRMAWADTLATRAATHAKSNKNGAAAVLYARAYEVAGRLGDLEKSRELVTKLQAQGRFGVDLQVSGPPNRIGPVKDAIVAGVTGIPDAALVTTTPTLLTRLTLKTQKCTETDTVTPATKDFVSGQVEKPNPQHKELTDQLAKAREEEATAKKRSEALWPELQTAEAALKAFDAEVASLEKTAAEAESKFTAANSQLTATRTRRDELQAQLDGLIAQNAAKDTVDQVQAQLAETEKRLKEWSEATQVHEKAGSEATGRLTALKAERAPAAEALDRLKAGYESVTKDRTTAQTLATDLAAKLAATPKTVWEDVHETLKYDVHDWKRTCVAGASAALKPAWKSSIATSREFAPEQSTEDRSHIGHEKAKLEADPKAFPVKDDDLVAKADTETTKAMIDWLNSLADDYYRERIGGATTELIEDPVGGTTTLVALYTGARGRLDENTMNIFASHLRREFGLEKIELLQRQTAAPK